MEKGGLRYIKTSEHVFFLCSKHIQITTFPDWKILVRLRCTDGPGRCDTDSKCMLKMGRSWFDDWASVLSHTDVMVFFCHLADLWSDRLRSNVCPASLLSCKLVRHLLAVFSHKCQKWINSGDERTIVILAEQSRWLTSICADNDGEEALRCHFSEPLVPGGSDSPHWGPASVSTLYSSSVARFLTPSKPATTWTSSVFLHNICQSSFFSAELCFSLL